MSEYQTLHFAAVDRPLDEKQLAYMEKLSSHAEVSRWEFSVEYHYSDFRGDAVEMLRRGYDVHLHYANYGIRKLAFRLPQLPCDKKTFATFEVDYGIDWKKDSRGTAGVLTIQPEDDDGSYCSDFFDFKLISQSLPKLREMLMDGDLRPLYLAWMACCFDDESLEPPVSPGLGCTDRALEALAEFYHLSPDLIAAAAEQSPRPSKKVDKESAGKAWVESLSKAKLKQIVHDLVTSDATTVQAETRTQIRQSTLTPKSSASPTTMAKPTRTLGQLKEAEESVQAERIERENAAEERARKKYLKTIAADPNKLIRRIDTLVAGRSREKYHQAADCLTDLAEALGEGPGTAKARQIAQRLRQQKPRSNVLIGILRKQGWIE